MEKKAFDLLRGAELSWWYKGRSLAIKHILDVYLFKKNLNILDFGAGFGASFSFLNLYGKVDAYEIYKEGVLSCKSLGYSDVFDKEADLGKVFGSYDLIAVLDVVEHIKDEKKLMELFNNLLNENGVLVLTVPAFMSLWSPHDIEHHHFRRYKKSEIELLLENNGFSVRYSTYWNFLLFPLALIVRTVLRKGGGNALKPHVFLNSILSALLYIESLAIPYISYPWGTGIIVIAHKKHK